MDKSHIGDIISRFKLHCYDKDDTFQMSHFMCQNFITLECQIIRQSYIYAYPWECVIISIIVALVTFCYLQWYVTNCDKTQSQCTQPNIRPVTPC